MLECLKDFTVQQFSEPQNCTFNLTALARIWNGTVKWKMEWIGEGHNYC